jgi:hypothetical protein
MSAHVDRSTPSGFASSTITFNHDLEPKVQSMYPDYERVRLAKWEEHTGTVEVVLDHQDIPAYAAALLALYVEVEARRSATDETEESS